MSARTGWRAGDALVLACRASRCRSGSANPAVLPVPVWAPPRTSRPCSTSGMACAWIGVGSTYPCSATAFSNSGSRSSSAKLGKRILSFRPRTGPKKTSVGDGKSTDKGGGNPGHYSKGTATARMVTSQRRVPPISALPDVRAPTRHARAPVPKDPALGNAPPSVDDIGSDNRVSRANIQTLGAAAAMLAHRSVQRKRQIRVDVPEKEERARFAREQQRVFAPPAEPRLARQLHFHHRCRIGEYAITEITDFARNLFRELPQPPPQHLVIVAPKRITCDKRLAPVRKDPPAVGRIGPVVHARGNDAQRARNERRRSRSFPTVLSHILEFAGETRCEPCAQ